MGNGCFASAVRKLVREDVWAVYLAKLVRGCKILEIRVEVQLPVG